VTGHCRDDDGAPPYWPWPEVLRELMVQCDDPWLDAGRDQLIDALGPRDTEDPHGDTARPALTDADLIDVIAYVRTLAG
jgi:hypothetical protein